MTTRQFGRAAGSLVAAGVGLAAASYAARAALTWIRYGHPNRDATPDPLLDRFMPVFEVRERHDIRVVAPANLTFAASCEMDLQQSRLARAIFASRERILGADRAAVDRPRGLVAETKALGWGILDEIPDRAIVMGALTQPWKPNVVFRALPPDDFAAFSEPGYAKIVWTLRADPVGNGESVARTETRVTTTDPLSRLRFRRYWSVFSPGIVIIRLAGLRLVKADAERRAKAGMTPARSEINHPDLSRAFK